ncbi:hypothetical protein ACLMAB_17740 [Brevibacillus laterosporus]
MFNCVLKWISAGSAFALFLSTVPVDVLAVSKTQVTVSVNEVKRKNHPTTDTKDDQDITTADQNTSTSKKNQIHLTKQKQSQRQGTKNQTLRSQ